MLAKQLGELVRCVEDCSSMLEELDKEAMSVDANPADPVKLGMRLKALCRRGTARCQQVSESVSLGKRIPKNR